MFEMPFRKYQGTGNDFVMIDNRSTSYLTRDDTQLIRTICDRRFGIGADGLILLQNSDKYDFEMIYFNADGRESSMCGNGGRCIVAFAKELKIIEKECTFLAIDGKHDAKVHRNGWVDLKMVNVPEFESGNDYSILDTGSPHYVVFVEDLNDINVVESGQLIRYSDRFHTEGINVNFVQRKKDGILVGTYERGVENETLSCGTGVTAAAIAVYSQNDNGSSKGEISIQTKGGQLKVRLEQEGTGFKNIWLCGPATKVFEGNYFIDKSSLRP